MASCGIVWNGEGEFPFLRPRPRRRFIPIEFTHAAEEPGGIERHDCIGDDFISLFFLSLSLYLFFAAHEEMRKLIETMPHPTRVDSLAWKLKYFYESCTALEHIVVPEQKLIRVIDQMGMESILNVFLLLDVEE